MIKQILNEISSIIPKKLIIAITHGFYTGGLTLCMDLLVANADGLNKMKIVHAFISSMLTFGAAFFISLKIITMKEEAEEVVGKGRVP